jgi:hypothetical protein
MWCITWREWLIQREGNEMNRRINGRGEEEVMREFMGIYREGGREIL